jgi:hypothetical protein
MCCDEEDKMECRVCGFAGTLDDFDCGGACPESLFCNSCGTEIDGDGVAAPLCGDCWGCKMLKDEGTFDAEQERRKTIGSVV